MMAITGPLLVAQPNEAKVIDHVRASYRASALVVRAELKKEGEDYVLYPSENWRSAPGYEAGRIILPRLAQLEFPDGIQEVLACFFLRESVSHYELFYVKDGRLDLAPSLPLQSLREELEKG